MTDLFITGTDTGVGKTVITAAIISLLCGEGVDVCAMKPVQTGCQGAAGAWSLVDLAFIARATGEALDPALMPAQCPFAFAHPCSPHLAAEMAGRRISIGTIMENYRTLKVKKQCIVIEGAGGLMVPLNENEYMLDLMIAIDAPVILTARPGLGTLNHTFLSINALRNAGLTVAGVIFCEATPGAGDYIETDNKKAVAVRGRVPILGTVPFMPDFDTVCGSAELFYRFCKQALPRACATLKGLVR
jgi:dethiobiotin synthetase